MKDQQRKFEEWNQLQEKIVNAQATVGQRLRSQLEYQEFRFLTSKTPPRNCYPVLHFYLNLITFLLAVHDCEQYEEDGFMFFQCNIKTDMSTLETWGSAMMDLRNRLVDFQTQTDKIVDLLSLRNAAANHSSHPTNTSQVMGISSDSLSSDTSTAINSPIQRDFGEDDYAFHQLTEHELQRCSGLSIPKAEQMPSIMLPPESAGQE